MECHQEFQINGVKIAQNFVRNLSIKRLIGPTFTTSISTWN